MKKLLSLLLAISLLLTSTALISTTVSATESEIWDGTVASSFASGTGTSSDPYIIKTSEQLAYLANVKSALNNIHIKLANDIYLNDTSNWEEWDTNAPLNMWTPIGKIAESFDGVFDGNGHTIYGVYVVDNDYSGLFFKGGTIKNLTLKESYIQATEYAGGISAYSSTISNCHNYATVVSDKYAGGISAYQEETNISVCSNHGYIEGDVAGGIVGYYVNNSSNLKDISESYNIGTIYGKSYAGGLIGNFDISRKRTLYNTEKYNNSYYIYYYRVDSSTTISFCYNSGYIISDKSAGGLCGKGPSGDKYSLSDDYNTSTSIQSHTYLWCYNVGKISAKSYAGQIIGIGGIMDSTGVYFYNSEASIMYFSGSSEITTGASSYDAAISGFGLLNVGYILYGNPDYPYPELKNNLQPHTHTYDEAINSEANCIQSGSKTLTCWCSYTYDEVIPAKGHDYIETIDIEATCTTDGSKTLTCHCGDTYTETILATGHNHIESITTEATCTTAGLKTFTCHCGDTYTETIVAPGHSISTVTVDPTCTEDGETYEACSVCKTIFGDKTPIPATGHSYLEEITTKATCTTSGLKTFSCSCGDTYTEAIPATGHKLKLVTNAATCTSSGTQYNLCENCGNIIGETTLLPITGHNYTTETQNATCTKDGLTTYTCSCGDTYTETIPATGHSYTEEIKREPTCTASGVKMLSCSCGNKKTEQIPATGHDAVTDKAVAPTCTKSGLTEGSHCNTCGATITAQQTIPATGHSYEEKTVTQATCTADGLKKFTCHCGDSYTETISKIAHSFGEWEYVSGNTYKRECTKCDEGIENKSIFLTLDKSSVNITNQSSYTLTATVTDNFTDDIVFTSSNSDVASVNSDGKVTAENIGSATVTATIRGTSISAVCTVNVTPRQFTVTWIVDGVENVQTLNENAQITKPENPQKDGYKFVGWTPAVPQTMPAYNLTFTAVFEELYTCPHCGTEFDKENEYNVHVKEEQKEIAINKASIKIQNNPTSRTIKYGETLKLTATVSNMPEGSKIAWYVDGSKKAEGQTFSVSPSSGTVTVTVKLIDSDGNVLVNSSGNEISDSQKVSVDSGFFQKIISFFKNLFGMNRTITQAFKGMF